MTAKKGARRTTKTPSKKAAGIKRNASKPLTKRNASKPSTAKNPTKPTTAKKPVKKKAPAPTRRAPLAPQSLLILHLDAEKLQADGLHLGDAAAFSGKLSTLLGSHVVIKDATTTSHLNAVLADLMSAGLTFDVVVVIAHSNATQIRAASDLLLPWEGFAGFLKPFKPRRLMLVACKGGRSDAGEALFNAMPHLRRIFACPVNASKDFGAFMLFAVPYVVATRRPRNKHVLGAQVAAVVATGRQVREWLRTTDKGNPDAAVFDLIADIADPIARKVPEALGALVDAFRGRR